jgi:hypothetical protein
MPSGLESRKRHYKSERPLIDYDRLAEASAAQLQVDNLAAGNRARSNLLPFLSLTVPPSPSSGLFLF